MDGENSMLSPMLNYVPIVESQNDSSNSNEIRFVNVTNVNNSVRDENFRVEIREFISTDLEIEDIFKSINPYTEFLNEHQQNALVHRLILFSRKKSCDGRITSAQFKIITDELLTFFPNESRGTFYTPFNTTPEGKRILASGKLYNHYTYLKSKGNKPKNPPHASDIDNTVELLHQLDEQQEYVNWLNAKLEPWSEVLEKWSKSYDLRQGLLRKSKNIFDYCKLFPCLTSQQGFDLIKLDFEKRFEKANEYYEKNVKHIFAKLKEHLPSVCSTKNLEALGYIKALNGIKEGDDAVIIYALLGYLIPPAKIQTVKRNAKGEPVLKPNGQEVISSTKPSVPEILNSLFILVTNSTDINSAVDERRTYFQAKKNCLQPTIILVGPSLSNISEIYVISDHLRYKCTDIYEAIKVTFNICYAFNAKYPDEAKHPWLIIQNAMFNITQLDGLSIPLRSLLNKLKK